MFFRNRSFRKVFASAAVGCSVVAAAGGVTWLAGGNLVNLDAKKSGNEAHLPPLSSFRSSKILNQSTNSISVAGSFDGLEGIAIVNMSRTPLEEAHVSAVLAGDADLLFNNDIYSSFLIKSDAPEANKHKVDIVFPATNRHLDKFKPQNSIIVNETAALYRQITLPLIEAIPHERLQWVRNILAKKKEAERIVFEDKDKEVGFMLHPDMKWDGDSPQSRMYCLAIVHKEGIRSIRDLDSSHLRLLRNVQGGGLAAIERAYGIAADKVQVYFHYQPSYYHLHVHFEHIDRQNAGGFHPLKSHLLSDVIQNIESDSNYYKKRTLTYVIDADSDLGRAMIAAGKNNNNNNKKK